MRLRLAPPRPSVLGTYLNDQIVFDYNPHVNKHIASFITFYYRLSCPIPMEIADKTVCGSHVIMTKHFIIENGSTEINNLNMNTLSSYFTNINALPILPKSIDLVLSQ